MATSILTSFRLLRCSSKTALSSLSLSNPNNRSFASSRRHQRRQRQEQRRRQLPTGATPTTTTTVDDDENKTKNKEVIQHKKPWYRYITIWPDPHGYDPEWEATQGIQWPKSREEWDRRLRDSWRIYCSSHEGWLLPEKTDKKKEEGDEKKKLFSEVIDDQKETINANVARNMEFLQEEGKILQDKVAKETGIVTLQDLQEWAGRQMKLATECLTTFMEGYREGRDSEVDRMLHSEDYNFFGGLKDALLSDDDDNTKRRKRRPKRRVRTVN